MGVISVHGTFQLATGGVAYILHTGARRVHVNAYSVHVWTCRIIMWASVSNTYNRMVGVELTTRQEKKKLFIFYVNVVFKNY